MVGHSRLGSGLAFQHDDEWAMVADEHYQGGGLPLGDFLQGYLLATDGVWQLQ